MRPRGVRISILMYHQVGYFEPIKTHRATYCQRARFVGQMRWLAMSGTPVISLGQCVRGLRGEEPLPSQAVVLTFDDAYENFADHALPVLRGYEFPATLYVPTRFIGRNAEWLAKDGLDPAPILSACQLRDLAKEPGVTIGAHGANHLRLAEIPKSDAKREIEDSKAELETLLDREVRHFCYPYGSVDPQVMRFAADAGFQSSTTCQRGSVTPDVDPMGLPRKAISYGDSLIGYIWKIHFKHALKGDPIRRSS